ncbi:MAG TPA: hypothetical protein VGT41_02585 [Candidatus Babeliales bacterium]|nr:hypothetical protein [Candidatus Babeliales bacterium]
MKPINFLKTISPKEQHNIAVWCRVAIVLTLITIIAITVTQFYQLKTFFAARKKYNQIMQKQPQLPVINAHQNKKLQEQEKELQDRKEFLAHIELKNERLLNVLTAIQKSMPTNCTIVTCNINGKTITLSVICPSTQVGYQYLEALSASPDITDLRMTSLQPHKASQTKQMIASLTGSIKV